MMKRAGLDYNSFQQISIKLHMSPRFLMVDIIRKLNVYDITSTFARLIKHQRGLTLIAVPLIICCNDDVIQNNQGAIYSFRLVGLQRPKGIIKIIYCITTEKLPA